MLENGGGHRFGFSGQSGSETNTLDMLTYGSVRATSVPWHATVTQPLGSPSPVLGAPSPEGLPSACVTVAAIATVVPRTVQ